MGRKYKYCSVCHCANDLMHCLQCKKAFHAKCAKLQIKSEAYTCNNCKEETTTENEGEDSNSVEQDHIAPVPKRKKVSKQKTVVVKEEITAPDTEEQEKEEEEVEEEGKEHDSRVSSSIPLTLPLTRTKLLLTEAILQRSLFLKSIKSQLKGLCEPSLLRQLTAVKKVAMSATATATATATVRSSSRRQTPRRAARSTRVLNTDTVTDPDTAAMTVTVPVAVAGSETTPARTLHSTDLTITTTPGYLRNITLKEYQIEGVNTLCDWFKRGVGGILGDEM